MRIASTFVSAGGRGVELNTSVVVTSAQLGGGVGSRGVTMATQGPLSLTIAGTPSFNAVVRNTHPGVAGGGVSKKGGKNTGHQGSASRGSRKRKQR
jgi:hypothetical protein